MKKILCPVDSSAAADNAIVYAAKLAQKTGATLELFNAQVLADLTPEEAVLGRDFNVGMATKQLEERALEVETVFRISCDANVVAGGFSLLKEIEKEASGFDLVVMGTNGEDDLNQTLFGSNTYRVIRKSSVPLMLVPEKCSYSEIRKIVYAFDYAHEGETPMTTISSLAKSLGAGLSLLQVSDHFSEEADDRMTRIQRVITDLYGGDIHVLFDSIYASDTAEGISSFMLAGKGDVLALCSKNSRTIGAFFDRSVTHKITSKASYPVFIFHR